MGGSKRYLSILVSAQTTATQTRQLCVMFLLEFSTVRARARTPAQTFQEKLATDLQPLRVNTQTYDEMEARLKQKITHQLLLS